MPEWFRKMVGVVCCLIGLVWIIFFPPWLARTQFVLNGEAIEAALTELHENGLDVASATFVPTRTRIKEKYTGLLEVRQEAWFSEGTIRLNGVGQTISIRFISRERLRDIDGTLGKLVDRQRCGSFPFSSVQYRNYPITYLVRCEGGAVELPEDMTAIVEYRYQVSSTDLLRFDPESKHTDRPLFPAAAGIVHWFIGYPETCE
ncbi:MAG: hypothetical protein ACOCXQ_04820 [Patescibacteria group bacterium]